MRPARPKHDSIILQLSLNMFLPRFIWKADHVSEDQHCICAHRIEVCPAMGAMYVKNSNQQFCSVDTSVKILQRRFENFAIHGTSLGLVRQSMHSSGETMDFFLANVAL